MILTGSNGDSLELTVVNYQYPGFGSRTDDDNWLVIEGNVTLGTVQWAFREPILMCTEAAYLSEWLREVAEWAEAAASGVNSTSPEDAWFIEPNISFSISDALEGGLATLTVVLTQESHAPGSGLREPYEEDYLALALNSQQLREAAATWDRDRAPFPERWCIAPEDEPGTATIGDAQKPPFSRLRDKIVLWAKRS